MMDGVFTDTSGNLVTVDGQFIPQGSSTKMISYVDSGGTRHTTDQNTFLGTYSPTFPNGFNESL